MNKHGKPLDCARRSAGHRPRGGRHALTVAASIATHDDITRATLASGLRVVIAARPAHS